MNSLSQVRKWQIRKMVASAQMAEREFVAAKAQSNGDYDQLVFARSLLVRDRHDVIAQLPFVERVYAWWLVTFGDMRR